jgi:hypothetical protein
MALANEASFMPRFRTNFIPFQPGLHRREDRYNSKSPSLIGSATSSTADSTSLSSEDEQLTNTNRSPNTDSLNSFKKKVIFFRQWNRFTMLGSWDKCAVKDELSKLSKF